MDGAFRGGMDGSKDGRGTEHREEARDGAGQGSSPKPVVKGAAARTIGLVWGNAGANPGVQCKAVKSRYNSAQLSLRKFRSTASTGERVSLHPMIS